MRKQEIDGVAFIRLYSGKCNTQPQCEASVFRTQLSRSAHLGHCFRHLRAIAGHKEASTHLAQARKLGHRMPYSRELVLSVITKRGRELWKVTPNKAAGKFRDDFDPWCSFEGGRHSLPCVKKCLREQRAAQGFASAGNQSNCLLRKASELHGSSCWQQPLVLPHVRLPEQSLHLLSCRMVADAAAAAAAAAEIVRFRRRRGRTHALARHRSHGACKQSCTLPAAECHLGDGSEGRTKSS
mmetsp:Transcript_68799/g.224111  ORF Transcript_68799/g.224111 Transcript_68799/m.224111 type:complete len:240 (-) Transcript_68799:2-721(-)